MSDQGFDVILVGNYLTTLVAAVGLAERGRRVCVVNPVPTWGGHFTRMQVGGLSFDPGAVSHEFTVFNDEGATDPRSYDSRIRSDVGRFIRVIANYTKSQQEMVKMPQPHTVYGGELRPDIIMSNGLELLRHPTLSGRIHAEQQLIARSGDHELHPRRKKSSPLFLERSYYDVSVANHGATLHSALFEPMFFKMSGISTTRLIALYHRIAWLPLYYPETLLSQYSAKPQQLQDTYFCYPKAGYIGALAETLVQKMEKLGVAIFREPIHALSGKSGKNDITLKDGSVLKAPKISWSLSHDPLVAAANGGEKNSFERWSATLLFATVPQELLKKRFSVLYAPDDRTLFYRASNQSECAGTEETVRRIVIEVNPDYAGGHGALSEAAISEQVRKDFVALGIIDDPTHLNIAGVKTLKGVLLLPCRENWRLLESERDILLDRYPDILFTRNVESFFTDTLNDQIIKGLKLVEQFDEA